MHFGTHVDILNALSVFIRFHFRSDWNFNTREINVALENWWLENDLSLKDAIF